MAHTTGLVRLTADHLEFGSEIPPAVRLCDERVGLISVAISGNLQVVAKVHRLLEGPGRNRRLELGGLEAS